MTLTLLAVALNDQPLTQPITAHFDSNGGTIGRGDHNTMGLPDPERHVSRLQAEIIHGPDGFVIRNVGAANPIVVAGRTLGRGDTAALAHGDEIRIGGYLLQADFSAGDAALEITRGRAMLTGSSAARTPPPAAAAARPQPARADPVAAPPAARLPDDFDPFAAPPSPAITRSSSPPASDDDPFAGLLPPAVQPPIDDVFGLRDGDDPLARFLAAAPALPAATAAMDPLQALFGDAPPVAPAAPVPDSVPARHAAFKPPPLRPAPQQPPTGQPPPRSQAPVHAAGPPARTHAPAGKPPAVPSPSLPVDEAARLWRALCDGAGIDLPLPEGPLDERLREVGRILRSAVDGALRLIAVRASTKHELRADMTMIQAGGNNPLKFSPDAKAGVQALLQPPTRGFLPGSDAMDDAMRDLVGHSIGTVAGLAAALEGVLGRFAPTELESKLSGSSLLDSVLPLHRKSRLWDLYRQHYQAIRDEAQDDFHTLFGKAFLAAYTQQVAQLERETRPPPKP